MNWLYELYIINKYELYLICVLHNGVPVLRHYLHGYGKGRRVVNVKWRRVKPGGGGTSALWGCSCEVREVGEGKK